MAAAVDDHGGGGARRSGVDDEVAAVGAGDAEAADSVEERARQIGVEGVGGVGRGFGVGARERERDGGFVPVEARVDGGDDVDERAVERLAGAVERAGAGEELGLRASCRRRRRRHGGERRART